MIPVIAFAGKTVAVSGLGGSGLVSGSALLGGGADVIGWDDSVDAVAKATSAGIPTADLRQVDWSRISALVLAPGVPLTHPAPHWTVALARAAAVEVIGDIELFCRERRARPPQAPLVPLTRTKGQQTPPAPGRRPSRPGRPDAHAGAPIGGNIGTAILSLAPPEEARAHVVECSSYQIDLAPTLDPSVGVLLNVSEDHLDRHGTLAHYAAVKERLVAGVQADGIAIIGVDDEWCAAAADRVERAGKKLARVSVRRPVRAGLYVGGATIMPAVHGAARAIAHIGGIGSLRGVHNAQNAACAAGAALALGLSAEVIQQGLISFPGLAHRMEQVGRKARVLFVNDSKATNADSAAQALACFPDIFWIAGGKAKTGGIASLARFFPRMRKAYLIGEAATEFAAELQGRVSHVVAGPRERAVELAAADAEAADIAEPVVLLSPACASFDQYRNFEVRGDKFRELVRALPGLTPSAWGMGRTRLVAAVNPLSTSGRHH